MDPRVDSDGDRHRGTTGTTGLTGTSTGTTGTTGTSGIPLMGTTPQGLVHGHHTTVTGEVLDPHISGTSSGSGLTTTTGTGTTSSAGPHKSGLLNKMDPRVDSDQDGSRLH
jgi:hypothetical protein